MRNTHYKYHVHPGRQYLFKFLGYPLQHHRHEPVWQLKAVSKQIFNLHVYIFMSEKAYNRCVPFPNQWAGWTIQPFACIATSTNVADHQRGLGQYVQPGTYAYNFWTHRSMNTTSFFLILCRHLTGRKIIDSHSTLPSNFYKVTSTLALRTQLLEKLDTIESNVSGTLQEQKLHYKRYFGNKVRPMPKFQLGQVVSVDRLPFTTGFHRRTKP